MAEAPGSVWKRKQVLKIANFPQKNSQASTGPEKQNENFFVRLSHGPGENPGKKNDPRYHTGL
jgi:hypothetical protein